MANRRKTGDKLAIEIAAEYTYRANEHLICWDYDGSICPEFQFYKEMAEFWAEIHRQLNPHL